MHLGDEAVAQVTHLASKCSHIRARLPNLRFARTALGNRDIGEFLRFEPSRHDEEKKSGKAHQPYHYSSVNLSETPHTDGGPNKHAPYSNQPANEPHFSVSHIFVVLIIGFGF